MLPAGKFGRTTVEERRQPQLLRNGRYPLFQFTLRHAVQPQRRSNVFANTQRRVVDELLVDHGEVALPHGQARHVAPSTTAPFLNSPSAGRIQPGHQTQQRSLAGERGA